MPRTRGSKRRGNSGDVADESKNHDEEEGIKSEKLSVGRSTRSTSSLKAKEEPTNSKFNKTTSLSNLEEQSVVDKKDTKNGKKGKRAISDSGKSKKLKMDPENSDKDPEEESKSETNNNTKTDPSDKIDVPMLSSSQSSQETKASIASGSVRSSSPAPGEDKKKSSSSSRSRKRRAGSVGSDDLPLSQYSTPRKSLRKLNEIEENFSTDDKMRFKQLRETEDSIEDSIDLDALCGDDDPEADRQIQNLNIHSSILQANEDDEVLQKEFKPTTQFRLPDKTKDVEEGGFESNDQLKRGLSDMSKYYNTKEKVIKRLKQLRKKKIREVCDLSHGFILALVKHYLPYLEHVVGKKVESKHMTHYFENFIHELAPSFPADYQFPTLPASLNLESVDLTRDVVITLDDDGEEEEIVISDDDSVPSPQPPGNNKDLQKNEGLDDDVAYEDDDGAIPMGDVFTAKKMRAAELIQDRLFLNWQQYYIEGILNGLPFQMKLKDKMTQSFISHVMYPEILTLLVMHVKEVPRKRAELIMEEANKLSVQEELRAEREQNNRNPEEELSDDEI